MDTPTDLDGDDSADDADASTKSVVATVTTPATDSNDCEVWEPCANEVERQVRRCPICRTDIQMILCLFDFYVTLCSLLWSVTFCNERLGHFRICFVVHVTINFVYVGNDLVWYRIHGVCNFHRMMCFFADFWCILILRRLFNSLCVSNVYFFLHEFITAYKILPVLVCSAPHNNILLSVTTLVQSAFHSYWSRVFHPPVWWSRVFQSRVFSRPVSSHAV